MCLCSQQVITLQGILTLVSLSLSILTKKIIQRSLRCMYGSFPFFFTPLQQQCYHASQQWFKGFSVHSWCCFGFQSTLAVSSWSKRMNIVWQTLNLLHSWLVWGFFYIFLLNRNSKIWKLWVQFRVYRNVKAFYPAYSHLSSPLDCWSPFLPP